MFIRIYSNLGVSGYIENTLHLRYCPVHPVSSGYANGGEFVGIGVEEAPHITGSTLYLYILIIYHVSFQTEIAVNNSVPS